MGDGGEGRVEASPLLAISLLAAFILGACAPASVGTSATPSAAGSPAGQRLVDADRAHQFLNRFTFGARPSDLAEIRRMGERAWLEQQLNPERIADRGADSILDRLEITHKSAFELSADHPQLNEFIANPGRLLGLVNDTAKMRAQPKPDSMPMSAMAQLAAMRSEVTQTEGMTDRIGKLAQSRSAVGRELVPSILLRAVKSDRQLLEVMTVFWENHFSVSSEKVIGQFALVDYDHTIRAHALGKFRDLLGAVATSPAMLYYLDNFSSSVDSLHPTMVEWKVEQRRAAHPPFGDTSFVHAIKHRRTGINENYARELMELHTVGVDGGYTTKDIQEVARCLTGWTVDNFQFGPTFSFSEGQHDAGEKVVLGVRIPGGRGTEDGQQVLDILARHPSTAHFIARKLVIHFVADDPPPALVERVAQTYTRTDGDIREMLRTIANSPEFNSRGAYRSKVKTPFELVASVMRVMDAKPDTTQQSIQLLTRLGQPIFGRSTPDGWPDQASAWMNSGALLNRVSLGQRVGAGEITNINLQQWASLRPALAGSPEQQVNGVIDAVLAGVASPETRRAMLDSPPAIIPTQHLGQIVAIGLGSADFQRR